MARRKQQETGHGQAADERQLGVGQEFVRLFRSRRRRLWLRGLCRSTLTAAPWLALISGGVLLWADRQGWFSATPQSAFAAMTLSVVPAAALFAALHRPRPARAALELDRELEGREVVLCAWEVTLAQRRGFDSPLGRRAQERAMALLQQETVRKQLAILEPSTLRPAVLALALLFLVPLLPLPRVGLGGLEAGSPRPEPRITAAGEVLLEQIAALDERLDLASEDEELIESLRLDQLAEALRSGELSTLEEALLAVEEVENAKVEATSGSDSSLFELVEEMRQEPHLGEFADALSTGQTKALRKALRQLQQAIDPEQWSRQQSASERSRAADRLQQVAAALEQAGRAEEAAALRELATALRAGDMERAEALLESMELSQALEAASELVAAGELSRELDELLELTRFLLSGAQPPGLTEECRSGSCLGQGQNGDQGPGPFPGRGSTNREGPSFAAGDPILRQRQSSQTTSDQGEYERLHPSRMAVASEMEDVRGSGLMSEQGRMLSAVERGPGLAGASAQPSLVAGTVASGDQEAAADLERVPLGFRELVRQYFAMPAAQSAAEADGGIP